MSPSLKLLTAIGMVLSVASASASPALDQTLPPPGSSEQFYMYSGGGCEGENINATSSAFSYDADTDRLSYEADRCYSSAGPPEAFPQLAALNLYGRFVWDATVDETGAVTAPGSASLYWDLGRGLQRVLSGDVVDVGFGALGAFFCGEGEYSNYCTWDQPSVLARVTFEDPIIRSLTGASVGDYLEWWGYFQIGSQTGPILSQSFSRDPLPLAFSGDVYWGYKVAEPGTLSLVGLALGALAFACRRKWQATD